MALQVDVQLSDIYMFHTRPCLLVSSPPKASQSTAANPSVNGISSFLKLRIYMYNVRLKLGPCGGPSYKTPNSVNRAQSNLPETILRLDLIQNTHTDTNTHTNTKCSPSSIWMGFNFI